MFDVDQVLVLIKGSTQPFDILLFDENGQPEILSVFDQATLVIREEEAGSNLLLRRTADGNLSINASASKLTGTLTQVEADALTPKPGYFIADVALRNTADQKWVHMDRIHVQILNSFAPHTP